MQQNSHCVLCTVVLQSYCPTELPDSPTNSMAPSTYSRSLGALATYTCLVGYSGSPTSTCEEENSTNGLWSAVIGSCTRTNKLLVNCSVQKAFTFCIYTTVRIVTRCSCARIVITNYCRPADAPDVPSNADEPEYKTAVYDVTSYECLNGYSGNVSITCLPAYSAVGKWSSISGSCARMRLTLRKSLILIGTISLSKLKISLSLHHVI